VNWNGLRRIAALERKADRTVHGDWSDAFRFFTAALDRFAVAKRAGVAADAEAQNVMMLLKGNLDEARPAQTP
jgi:hypothetical protein